LLLSPNREVIYLLFETGKVVSLLFKELRMPLILLLRSADGVQLADVGVVGTGPLKGVPRRGKVMIHDTVLETSRREGVILTCRRHGERLVAAPETLARS
jgi:hypothetical protein